MATTTMRWERLEEYLFDHDKDGTDFSSREYAAATGLDPEDASLDIQGYLTAQRGVRSRTLYVLRRKPGTRTFNARWAVGAKSRDARLVGRTFFDDTRARVLRAFKPDLIRIRAINPRAARQVEAQIDSVIEGALLVLETAATLGADDTTTGASRSDVA